MCELLDCTSVEHRCSLINALSYVANRTRFVDPRSARSGGGIVRRGGARTAKCFLRTVHSSEILWPKIDPRQTLPTNFRHLLPRTLDAPGPRATPARRGLRAAARRPPFILRWLSFGYRNTRRHPCLGRLRSGSSSVLSSATEEYLRLDAGRLDFESPGFPIRPLMLPFRCPCPRPN